MRPRLEGGGFALATRHWSSTLVGGPLPPLSGNGEQGLAAAENETPRTVGAGELSGEVAINPVEHI